MCCARIKGPSKQVHQEAVVEPGKVVDSYRSNSNGEVPKGSNVHTVVFPTSASLVKPDRGPNVTSGRVVMEPDAVDLDLHAPGIVPALVIESEYWKTQMEDANILPTGAELQRDRSWGRSPSPSPAPSPSPSLSPSPSPTRSFAGTKWEPKPGGPQRRPLHPLRPPPISTPAVLGVLSLSGLGSFVDAASPAAISSSTLGSLSRILLSTGDRLEIGQTSVDSSAPDETAEEMEARVRRRIEIEIRQEMAEAAVKKEQEAAGEKAEAQKVVRDLAEVLASRQAKAAAEAAKDAAARRARDAAEAVAREASEARMRDMLREAEAAEAAAVAAVAAAAAQRTAVAVEAEAEAAEEEERRRTAALALTADDVNTTSLAAAITTAEASGVKLSELGHEARILLARAKAEQEVQRQRKET
jgi:hypothetical protein